MPVKELKIDLVPHLRKVKIKARRDILNRVLEGNWSTIFKGQGLEFAGYRAYSYDDDASKIDWGASLRSHEILVRELEEYRNFNVFFLFITSWMRVKNKQINLIAYHPGKTNKLLSISYV